MSKPKICSICKKQVPVLWRANPKTCKACAIKTSKPIPKNKDYKIPQVSKSQTKRLAQYRKLRDAFMKEHPLCQAQLQGCTKKATDLHHSKGRIGHNLTDVSTYIALCRNCHTWAENHPEEAKSLGLSQNRL
jgi:hypothetical protein